MSAKTSNVWGLAGQLSTQADGGSDDENMIRWGLQRWSWAPPRLADPEPGDIIRFNPAEGYLRSEGRRRRWAEAHWRLAEKLIAARRPSDVADLNQIIEDVDVLVGDRTGHSLPRWRA